MDHSAPILAANTLFSRRFAEGQMAALVAGHYGDTVHISAPGLPLRAWNQTELLELLGGYHADYLQITFQTDRVLSFTDSAFEFGTVTLHRRDGGGPETLRYAMAWQLTAKGWRLVADFGAEPVS